LPPIEEHELQQLSLFDLGVDMAALRVARQKLSLQTRAPNTRRALEGNWRTFSAWCRDAGRKSLPASSETVELYLTDLGRSHKVSTLQQHAWAIAQQHKVAGLASPVGPGAREVIAATARARGVQTAPKAAITPDDLREMVHQLDVCTHRGARDRAILVLGFATGMRRSELAGLELRDVEFVSKGLVVTLRRSKVDQNGEGRQIGVFRGRRPETCPVRALRAWLRKRGDRAGSLFGVQGWTINEIVRGAAESIGLDPADYGAHSLRAGMITAANAEGVPDSAIMRRSGHKSVQTLSRYVRHRDLFAFNPLSRAL